MTGPAPTTRVPPDPTPAEHGRASMIGPDGTWPMQPGSGPCRTWPLYRSCSCMSTWGPIDQWTPEQYWAVEAATEILWRSTAGQYGLCEEIIRPCRTSCEPEPRGRFGDMLPVSCGCGSTSRCGCPDPDEIILPGPVYWEPLTQTPDWRSRYRPADRRPATDDTDHLLYRYRLVVWIDGAPIYEPGWPIEWVPGEPLPEQYTPHPGQYWVYGPDRLVRTDGGTWPVCQDLTRPLQPREAYPHEAVGTFGVQYWHGTPVPAGGRRAVSLLACELWKACRGDSGCRLPQHVQSITREGVSYTMVDLSDWSAGGKTGLPDVDMWINSVNPYGMKSGTVVESVDMPEYRSEWTTGGPSTPPGWWGG